MKISYKELRKIAPEKARELLRKILAEQNSNVSEAARIAGVNRRTVRRARDGPLEDVSTRPHNSPNQTDSALENLVSIEGKKTGYRYRRLSGYLHNQYGVSMSEDTVKAILRRKNVKKKRIRTANRNRRPLYDYEALFPFAEMQLDTKHVLDKSALPKEVYEHIQAYGLPIYEWNIIDACGRVRFTAYSHELNATFGRIFIFLVVMWLRTHGISVHIHIQADNGAEFCHSSKRKEELLNQDLAPLNASFTSIPAGKKYLQGIVENSHRHDDEQFLSIHPIRCKNDAEFLLKAQKWQDTWNAGRPHFGVEMHGKTPLEKLREKHILCPENILRFPVLLLEDLVKYNHLLGGHYVPTNYPSSPNYEILFFAQ